MRKVFSATNPLLQFEGALQFHESSGETSSARPFIASYANKDDPKCHKVEHSTDHDNISSPPPNNRSLSDDIHSTHCRLHAPFFSCPLETDALQTFVTSPPIPPPHNLFACFRLLFFLFWLCLRTLKKRL